MSLVVPNFLDELFFFFVHLWNSGFSGLRGELPDNFSRLSNLQSLDLSGNVELTGSFPPYNLRQCSFVFGPVIYTNFNPFGTRFNQSSEKFRMIPPSVFKLENLTTLMLSSNDKLTGNISSVICELKFLEILDLSNNSFSGFIPQCLGNFSDGLSVLHLGGNNLHGNIPSIYSKGNNLSYLNFNGNKLKGIFDLSNNSVSGPLPTEYFNNFKAMMSVRRWSFLKFKLPSATLDLSCNKFTGKIPESLGKLKSLIQLNLSHNSLIVLNLLYNQLEGAILVGNQFNTFAIGSYEGNLGLCGFPLQAKCNKGEWKQQPPSNFEKEDSMFEEGFGWKAVAMGYVVFRAKKTAAWFVKMVEDSAHQNAKRLRRKNAPRNGGRRY
ncbi:hypothetical protein NC651_026011 [Populus alba x Populus x berolinensis]|nr:hypothetical protein NC651_026011 [Populus alba x Populus x berolinensis]